MGDSSYLPRIGASVELTRDRSTPDTWLAIGAEIQQVAGLSYQRFHEKIPPIRQPLHCALLPDIDESRDLCMH